MVYENSALDRLARLIDICKRHGADTYVNPAGGQELYTKEEFAAHGIALEFLRCIPLPYPQPPSSDFTANLSIVDVMMHNSRDQIAEQLRSFQVV